VTVTQDDAQAVVDLGALALRLSRVDRITFHEDGKRPETDSDHTVMLALIAPAFAERFLPDLNLGLVTQYAVVHDLVEAYAGDTSTLRITVPGKIEKKKREHDAALRIAREFDDSLPWVPMMVARYELLIHPEARYVKALDKLLPKVTHILNDGATFDTAQGHMTHQELVIRYARQIEELKEYAQDFPPLFELRARLVGMVLDRMEEKER
jgi:putative hydrolase of HD superfamily